MSETEFAADDAPNDGDEPTMEEILSSIRRIISDGDDSDEDIESSDESAEAIVEEDDDDDEVLELTEILAEEDPFDSIDELDVLGDLDGDVDLMSPDDIDDLEFSQAEPVAEAEPVIETIPVADAQELPAMNVAETLISNQVGEQVNQNFNLLANTLLTQNGAGQTVEAMVMALMRPMLKGWLDDNLPVMVEKIIREEIERVSRGGKM
ncbi:MAG: DUF2497 domain-containing protein [Rhizobiales bacterium]|nr:DUF2497 domain-containing protein [Hyphomicrobiales bacterium]NRB14827.1 DUF2497 domain-containing protein [Hyphomicrobiales bacterium]